MIFISICLQCTYGTVVSSQIEWNSGPDEEPMNPLWFPLPFALIISDDVLLFS